MDAGSRVHLAHPAAMQQYSGLKYTADPAAARWVAHVFRLGVLPQGSIDPQAQRAVRDVLRQRAPLVQQHTANGLSVQHILARHTGAHFGGKRMHPFTQEARVGVRPEADPVLAVTSSLAVLDCLSQQINTLDQTVHRRLKRPPASEQLLTVDGIRAIVAQTIVLETGDVGRFPTVGA